jgi:RNA polymerase sigma-70 factor (ECF subfamily)
MIVQVSEGPRASERLGVTAPTRQDALYQEVAARYGAALDRLARAHEADGERRKDLLQEIHVGLWRSLAGFDGRCSLRTWMYRVAHNVAASHALREGRTSARAFTTLAALESVPAGGDSPPEGERREVLGRLLELVQKLAPGDRQLILLYLEGLDAEAISDITGLTPGNVATKIHRIKKVLARFAQETDQGERHDR